MIWPHHVAEQVLDDLSITTPSDLELLDAIAWERGALVQPKHLDGSEARITIAKRSIIIISTAITDPRRKRFSIAHELGHLEMHRYKSRITFCTSEDMNDWRLQKEGATLEQEANEFASALLLPERFFAQRCPIQEPALELIADLAGEFNTSLTATALRYLHFCGEPCAVVFSQNNCIRWFRGSKSFEALGLFVDVKSRLDATCNAVSFFKGRTFHKRPCRVKASAWFRSGPYHRDATITEQSWPMPSYNAVLTLLWVDEDIDGEEWF